MKSASKWLVPLFAALCLSTAYTSSIAAPGDTAQQSDSKPDCKKTPDDPRCAK